MFHINWEKTFFFIIVFKVYEFKVLFSSFIMVLVVVNFLQIKIHNVGYWLLTLPKDACNFCCTFDSYPKASGLNTLSMAKLTIILLEEPLTK